MLDQLAVWVERHKQVYQDLMPDVIILLHLCAFVLPLPVLDLAKSRGSSCLFLFSFYSCSATTSYTYGSPGGPSCFFPFACLFSEDKVL
jgi:hypothetical protein